jgi:hypothetical protein
MPHEERIWAVLFTSAGLSELGHELQHYLREGPLGSYLFCKEVDMSQPYFRVIVSYHRGLFGMRVIIPDYDGHAP